MPKEKTIWSKLLPYVAGAGIIVLVCLIAADYFVGKKDLSASNLAMGTVVTQKLSGKKAKEASEQIIDRILYVERNNLSMRMSSSDISKINENSGEQVTVSKETAQWLSKTLEICKSSDYSLDISIGALTSLWDIGGDNAKVPLQNEIDTALKTVGCDKIRISDNTVEIPAFQLLDMGALGKGIACDEAKKIAESQNLKRAVVSVGGSILLFGDGEFSVGVRNPLGESNDYMGVLKTHAACISTSGNYEKVLTADGKTYHHILSSKVGYPVDSGLKSVTVVCSSGLVSDALSTSCFVLGYEKSLPLLSKYEAQAIFILNDNTVLITDGLKDDFEIKSSDFKLKAVTQ